MTRTSPFSPQSSDKFVFVKEKIANSISSTLTWPSVVSVVCPTWPSVVCVDIIVVGAASVVGVSVGYIDNKMLLFFL